VRGAYAWFYPAGFTILEVVVALVLFALILGVSGLALASLREPTSAAITRQLTDARAEAIRTGRPVSVAVALPDTAENHAPRTTHLLFLPDGRAVGEGVDALTGAPNGKP
jgi:prepilin-type N-terminal cleavage/methylation domain-containing protein